jgi:hypothetical protein
VPRAEFTPFLILVGKLVIPLPQFGDTEIPQFNTTEVWARCEIIVRMTGGLMKPLSAATATGNN